MVADVEGALDEHSHESPTPKLHLRSGLTFLSSAWLAEAEPRMRQENADFGATLTRVASCLCDRPSPPRGQMLLPWVVVRCWTEGPAGDLRPQGLGQQQLPSPLPGFPGPALCGSALALTRSHLRGF